MNINSTAIGMSVLNQQRKSMVNIADSVEKLSSANMINRSADDASGLSILQKMYSMQTGLSTTSVNTQDAMSYLQTADGVSSSVSEMYLRLDELALRASNSIMGGAERSALQYEADAITDEIARLTEHTTFNGKQIFSGEDFVANAENGTTINLSEFVVPEIDLSSVEAANASLENISSARNALLDMRGDIGAMDNSLQHSVANLEVTNQNLVAAGSRIGDTNYAMELLSLTRDNLLQNTSFAMMSQYNQSAGLILQMLR